MTERKLSSQSDALMEGELMYTEMAPVRSLSAPSLTQLTLVGTTKGDFAEENIDARSEGQVEKPTNSAEPGDDNNDPSEPAFFMPVPIAVVHLSRGQLKQLCDGPTINILYRPTERDYPFLLVTNFPKKIAIAFCSKWREELSPIPIRRGKDKGRAVARPWNEVPENVVITNGCPETYDEILQWMWDCCDRGRLVEPVKQYKPGHFYHNYLIRLCSTIIGCNYLTEVSSRRMQGMVDAQVHTHDIECIWCLVPEDPEMKSFLVEHVASRIVNGSLRGKGHYWGLRRRLPDFDQAINDQIRVWREERWRAKARALLERQDDGAAAENWLHRRSRSQPRPRRPESQQEEDMARDGQVQQQAVIHAPVVRRGTSGRPTWARLDLAAMGVTRRTYSGSV